MVCEPLEHAPSDLTYKTQIQLKLQVAGQEGGLLKMGPCDYTGCSSIKPFWGGTYALTLRINNEDGKLPMKVFFPTYFHSTLPI